MATKGVAADMTEGSQLTDVLSGLLRNEHSIIAYLEEGLRKNPHGPAIICMHQATGHLSKLLKDDDVSNEPQDLNTKSLTTDCLSITYIQLMSIAQRLVTGWMKRELNPGSTILICVPNGSEFCIILWASVLMRLTIVCMDPAILAASSHKHLKVALRSLKPSIIVVPNLVGAVSVDIAVQELRIARPVGILLDEEKSSSEWKPLSTFVDNHVSGEDAEVLMDQARNDDPQRIHSILFTSGTSGKPKGCPLRVAGQTHFLRSWSWLLNERNSQRALQQAHNSRAIAPTQILQTWSTGGTVLMPSRSFHIEDTISAIETFGATFVVLSPAMVHSIADLLGAHSNIDLSSVRTIQIGGDAVSKAVLLKCGALFPKAQICTHHGMSEGVAAFKWPFFDKHASQIPYLGETCPTGKVAPGSTIRLWNANKQCVTTRNEQGELHIRSSSIIHHYLGGESEESFYDDAEGRWFITGDTATMDDDGTVYILGRSKDAIKRAGITIMPGPLESLIQQFLGTQVSCRFPILFNKFIATNCYCK